MSRTQSPVREGTLQMSLLAERIIEATDAIRALQIQVNELRNESRTIPRSNIMETTEQITENEQLIKNYKLALHLIPEFDGTNVESFIEHVQAAVKRLAPDQHELLLISIIAQKITGRAKGSVKLGTVPSFPQLYNKLRLLHGRAQNLSALEVQRDTCIQGNGETIDNFISRFSKIHDELIATINSQDAGLTRILVQEELCQQKSIEIFRRNVKGEISDHLYSRDLDTLNAAFSRARMFEGELQLRKMRIQRNENYKKPTMQSGIQQRTRFQIKECDYCKRRGHEEKDCRTKMYHQQRNQQHGQSTNQPNFHGRSFNNQPPGHPSRHSHALAQDHSQSSNHASYVKDQAELIREHHELE